METLIITQSHVLIITKE